MTSKKTTRRALFSSFMALLLCCSMLVGTTFAWFTDSVTSTGNIIKSGTLDVEMTWSDTNSANEADWKDASAGAIFDYKFWEPGYTQVKYVKIENVGDLAFKYQLNILPDAQPVVGQPNLADVIEAYLVPAASAPATREAVDAYMQANTGATLSQLMADPDGAAYGIMLPTIEKQAANIVLPPAGTYDVGTATYCVILHMQESAGNEYQNLSVGDGFSVQLLATQLTAEIDSFGPDYDVDSEYDDLYVPTTAAGKANVADANDDGLLDTPVTVGDGAGFATFAADTKLANGATELSFKVSGAAAPTADVDAGEGVIALNIDVEGLADDNTVPVAITYKTLVGLKDVVVYHKGEAMTSGFDYDAATGIVTITSANFSPFDLVFTGYSFTDAAKTQVYYTMAEAIDAGEVIMARDVALEGAGAAYTITKSFKLNLGGHTLSYQSTGTGNQEMFLVKGDVFVANGTIEYTHVGANMGWNSMSTIFDITAGGKVTLNKVDAKNLGGTDMNFVAHLNNWGEATFNVDDCLLKATYCPVRVFNSGNDMNYVTITNSDLISEGASAFWVHNYTVADFGTQEKADIQAKLLKFDIFNGTNTFKATNAAPIRYGFTNSIRYDAEGVIGVDSADALVAALATGDDVSMTADIKINPANMSNAYGTTGLNITNGQSINGNGHTLDIKGAGGTWDSGINTTGGEIKNLTVTGSFRGIFVNHNSTYSERVILDNVTIDGTVYTISCDQGMKQGLTATNSTFNGWTSYAATIGDVKFENCTFGEGSGYAFCRPYASTEFVGCEFEAGFLVDPVAKVTFENCTLDGVALTADNLATLVTSNIANATVK